MSTTSNYGWPKLNPSGLQYDTVNDSLDAIDDDLKDVADNAASALTAGLAGKAAASHTHAAATSVAAGFMSATQVQDLERFATGQDYTSLYGTISRTLIDYTADAENVAYAGLASGVGGSPYMSVADGNALRLAVENLRLIVENQHKIINALIADAKTAHIID